MFDQNSQEVKDIVDGAIRLDSDMYGNPRHYIGCISFHDESGFYRPNTAGVSAYRGKKYGRGWVFNTYNLARAVADALNNREKDKAK